MQSETSPAVTPFGSRSADPFPDALVDAGLLNALADGSGRPT
jgi:hypothetical protein